MTRLPKETASDPKGVEINFCERFDSLKRIPMTDEMAKIYLSLILMEDDDENLAGYVKKDFSCQILEKRLQYIGGYSTDMKTAAVISMLCEGLPGMVVMYSYYLAYWGKKNNTKHITFEMFGMNVFPVGFPSMDDLSKLWDEQKVDNSDIGGPDNLLDHPKASESLILA